MEKMSRRFNALHLMPMRIFNYDFGFGMNTKRFNTILYYIWIRDKSPQSLVTL